MFRIVTVVYFEDESAATPSGLAQHILETFNNDNSIQRIETGVHLCEECDAAPNSNGTVQYVKTLGATRW